MHTSRFFVNSSLRDIIINISIPENNNKTGRHFREEDKRVKSLKNKTNTY
jgi:hypothetical protein